MGKKIQDVTITISAIGLIIMLTASVIAITGKLVMTDSLMPAGQDFAFVEVVVQPGDTLWTIAKSQVPDSDPRDVVGSIRDLNQLQSADIFPGQVLTVFVKKSFQPLQLAEGRSTP